MSTAVLHKKRLILLVVAAGLLSSGCAATQQSQHCLVAKRIGMSAANAGPRIPTDKKLAPQQADGTSLVLPASHREGMEPPVQFLTTPQDQRGVDVRTTDSTAASDNPLEELPEPSVQPFPASKTQTEQSVDYFVSIALARHPKIQAARSRVAAASNVIPQARALPDPKFNNTFWPIKDQALQTAGGRVAHQFQLSQGVPWLEKLDAKAAIASRQVQIAKAEVARIELEIAEAVRLACYEIWFANRAIEILEETRDVIDDIGQVAEARYKSGGTQQDVLRAQLEADRLDDQLVQLTKQKEQAQADLAALVQEPLTLVPEIEQDIGLTTALEQLDNLVGLAERCNPELKSLAWEIRRDREKKRLACLQKYPDFQLGLNYSIIDDGNTVLSPVADGHDNISFTVGVTLPIWREKIKAGIREATYELGSSTQRLEAERDVVYGRLRRLMAQAESLVEQKGIYEDRIIPRTEDTLKISFADYRGKRTDFFTLVETYRELLMFETQLARIEATLAGTIAQVERTAGCAANDWTAF